MTKKIQHGQFYTIRNPFFHPLVREWYNLLPEPTRLRFTEPFAGANNIIRTFTEAFPDVQLSQWRAYDLHPEEQGYNVVPEITVAQRDTIKQPVDTDVVVTNPPYLAKYSASRKGIVVDYGQYVDLYELALAQTLAHAPYVAAIIPETFITRKLFRERLYGFISIQEDLFEDTTFPVGLALWVPEPTGAYQIWSGERLMGRSDELRAKDPLRTTDISGQHIVFNAPHGHVGLYAVDGSITRIRFAEGSVFPPEEIKHSSRIVTRLDVYDAAGKLLVDQGNLQKFISAANTALEAYRRATDDLFITTFKGKRRDGRFRKRLDYKTAKVIIALALQAMR